MALQIFNFIDVSHMIKWETIRQMRGQDLLKSNYANIREHVSELLDKNHRAQERRDVAQKWLLKAIKTLETKDISKQSIDFAHDCVSIASLFIKSDGDSFLDSFKAMCCGMIHRRMFDLGTDVFVHLQLSYQYAIASSNTCIDSEMSHFVNKWSEETIKELDWISQIESELKHYLITRCERQHFNYDQLKLLCIQKTTVVVEDC